MSLTLANASRTSKRRELDFYPTPSDVTEALIYFLRLPKHCLIWEPACGDGAMSRVLEDHGYTVFSSDIRTDTGYGQQGRDFLITGPPTENLGAIITNPPFNQSEAFIRRALKFAPIVAMLLKSQYWHAKKRFGLFQEACPTWVLPLTWRPDFKNGGRGKPTMEVYWTVWMSVAHVRSWGRTYSSPAAHYCPLVRP